jgi:hypothetical protein
MLSYLLSVFVILYHRTSAELEKGRGCTRADMRHAEMQVLRMLWTEILR